MNKKTLVISLTVLLLGAGCAGFYLVTHKNATSSEPVAPQKQNAPNQTPEQAKAADKTAQNTPMSPTISVGQPKSTQAQGNVTGQVQITGTDNTTTGTCVFTYENDIAKPVIRQVAAKDAGSSMTCNSGAIPEVEFSAVGTWKLTVRYFTDNQQAVNSTDVVIN